MKMVKTLVAASITATLFATAAAQAATVTNHPSTGATFGETIINETTRTVTDLPIGGGNVYTITLGGTESLSIDDSFTLTLNNGATWAAIASADLLDDGAAGNFALVSIADPAVAIFRATAAVAGASVITLAATATVNTSAVPASGAVTLQTDISGFVGGVATSLYGSPLTMNLYQLAPVMTATIGTGTGTFDVATGYQQLTAATSADAGAPFDDSNVVAVATTVNAAMAAGSTTAGQPAAVVTAGATLFTLAGPMTGVDTVIDTAGGLITSATATGGAPTGGTVANNFFIDTANDIAYAIGAGGHAAGVADNSTMQFNFAQDVSHDISSYTLTITRLVDGGYAATSVGSGTLANFGRNGSAFASNSVGSLNKLTVTDRSGNLGGTGAADGAISLTVYDAAGNTVTCTGLTIPNLTSNATVTIQGADITGNCPSAKRIEGNVNSNSILVTNVKTTSDGATATPGLAAGGGTSAN